jgi:hypothetical protein
MSADIGRTVLHEEVVLNKFEGDVIVETITIVDGVIVDIKTFENGEV